MIDPIVFDAEKKAMYHAWYQSVVHTNVFFYVLFSMSSGKYIVDTYGGGFSDEKLIATFYNGELQD